MINILKRGRSRSRSRSRSRRLNFEKNVVKFAEGNRADKDGLGLPFFIFKSIEVVLLNLDYLEAFIPVLLEVVVV